MKNQRNAYRILQITKAKFPPEIRVAKEGRSLAEAGYGSAVLCPPNDGQPERETWQGIDIFRPSFLGRRSMLDKFIDQSALLSPAWFRAVRRVIAEYEPNALHVHDIWLGRAVFAARKQQRIVMDLHENMPAAVDEYRKGHHGPQLWFLNVFHRHRRIFSHERKLLERSDMVLAVVEEARERVILDHPHLDSANVVNVENLESKRFIADSGGGKPVFGKDHFSVLYIGGFGPHRGVDTLIRALVMIKQHRRNIKVQLIGARPSQYLDMLKDLVSSLEVQDLVSISGWVPAGDVLANIRQADVCCVPHHANAHTDSTIPHKLYQYMIARRPLLVSSSAPLARTVRQANSGLIFQAGDAGDCAARILELEADPSLARRYADNGYRYVIDRRHNWEEESAPCLIAAYDKLFNLHCGANVSDG